MKIYQKVILFLFMFFFSLSVFAQNEDCLDCHGDEEESKTRNGKVISLYVDENHFTASVHGDMDCIECHVNFDADEEPHRPGKNIYKVDCLECHEEYGKSVKLDIHHRLKDKVDSPPTCISCHGKHQINNPKKIKNKTKVYCSSCHEKNKVKYTYKYHSDLIPNAECLDCHEDDDTNFEELLTHSVHDDLFCADCHNYIAHNIEVHEDTLSVMHKADCFVCHNDVNNIYKESIHGIALQEGIDEAAKCWDCHDSHDIKMVDDSTSAVSMKNIPGACGKCHDDIALVEQFDFSVSCPEAQYNLSVHAKVLAEGEDGPNCISCHGAHDINNRMVATSKINALEIPNTCGQCHEEIAEEYKKSIHWIRAKKGVRYAPICNDCHCEHGIHAVSSDEGNMAQFQQETCIKCHQSNVLNQRTSMNGNEPKEYLESYHGLAAQRGDEDAAYCVDCHNVHSILPANHPESSINEKNLVETCKKCHEDANVQFANSYSHQTASLEARTIENVVEIIYIWLIILVIGGMVLHNILIFIKESGDKRKKSSSMIAIPRFFTNERIQHLILLSSFIILAITGFTLKFPEAFWSVFLKDIGMSEEIRQNIHRTSAVIMGTLGFYHVIYLFVTRRGRFQLVHLLPTIKDVKDAVNNIMYYLNLSSKKPEFAYYDYAEKAEYWALIWGTFVMGATGLVLWFPTYVDEWAPIWFIKVSETIHYYEAILASLAILVWHWFFVMFRPTEYPMNFTWLDGDTTIDHFKHHHYYQYKISILEIADIIYNKKDRNELSHVTELILESLENEEIKPSEFLYSEFASDNALKKFVEKSFGKSI